MILEKQYGVIKKYYNEYVQIYRRYIEGKESIYAMERLTELLIQSILDLAAMIASKEKGVKPSTYRELALFLADKLGLDREYREFLKGLTGFRNILIHGYTRLDRDLEDRAFREIYEKIEVLINRIDEIVDDPCIDDVLIGIKRVCERLDYIDYIILYGSLARNGCGRDIDLAVKGRFKSALDLGRLIVELEHELGISADLIDVVDIDNVPPQLLKKIIDEAIIVCGEHDLVSHDLSRKYLDVLDVFDEEENIKRKIEGFNGVLKNSS